MDTGVWVCVGGAVPVGVAETVSVGVNVMVIVGDAVTVAVVVGVQAGANKVRVSGHAAPPHLGGECFVTVMVYGSPHKIGETDSVY